MVPTACWGTWWTLPVLPWEDLGEFLNSAHPLIVTFLVDSHVRDQGTAPYFLKGLEDTEVPRLFLFVLVILVNY